MLPTDRLLTGLSKNPAVPQNGPSMLGRYRPLSNQRSPYRATAFAHVSRLMQSRTRGGDGPVLTLPVGR